MKKTLLITGLFLGLVASTAQAEMTIIPLPAPGPDTDCSGPAVASSPDGTTMIAYTIRDVTMMSYVVVQPVPTTALPMEVIPEPIILGTGSSPAICWTRKGFVCAIDDGSLISIYRSIPNGSWNRTGLFLAVGAVTGLDLWGVSSEELGPHAFLTYQVWKNPPHGGFEVYFNNATVIGWPTPELVVAESPVAPHPQVTWSVGSVGPWPTIYYLAGVPGDVRLVHTTKDLEAGWSAPIEVFGDGVSAPTPLGGAFDVVTHVDLSRNILGLGPQPTCPCGSIHHQAHVPGSGWQPSEELTVNYDTYDWPASASLARDDLGTTYALWTQLDSGPDMEPKRRRLEYRTRSNGSWIDEGDFLDGQSGPALGELVAVDVTPDGLPVLAWSRRDTIAGEPQPEQIWIARRQLGTAVDPGNPPRSPASVSAWPNPFNPRVKLALEIPVDGPARLEIFDARGRRVCGLIDEVLLAGPHDVTWEGEDGFGRAVPSGVYFARLTAGQEVTVKKLVLAR